MFCEARVKGRRDGRKEGKKGRKKESTSKWTNACTSTKRMNFYMCIKGRGLFLTYFHQCWNFCVVEVYDVTSGLRYFHVSYHYPGAPWSGFRMQSRVHNDWWNRIFTFIQTKITMFAVDSLTAESQRSRSDIYLCDTPASLPQFHLVKQGNRSTFTVQGPLDAGNSY